MMSIPQLLIEFHANFFFFFDEKFHANFLSNILSHARTSQFKFNQAFTPRWKDGKKIEHRSIQKWVSMNIIECEKSSPLYDTAIGSSILCFTRRESLSKRKKDTTLQGNDYMTITSSWNLKLTMNMNNRDYKLRVQICVHQRITAVKWPKVRSQ